MFKLLSISKLILTVFAVLMFTSFPAASLAQDHENPEKPVSNILLLITGDEGTRFQGECVITGPNGRLEKTIELEGEVPQERRFEGAEIHCSLTQITADGLLEVKLTRDGNTSRSRTRGQDSTINIRIR